MVPENIHTPTTEGIGNSEGEGGVKDPGNSRGEGGCMIDLVSRGPLIQYGFQKSFLTYKVDFHMKNSGLNTCI